MSYPINGVKKELLDTILNSTHYILSLEGFGCLKFSHPIKEILTPQYLEKVYNKFLEYKVNYIIEKDKLVQ